MNITYIFQGDEESTSATNKITDLDETTDMSSERTGSSITEHSTSTSDGKPLFQSLFE